MGHETKFNSVEELRDAMGKKWPGRSLCVMHDAWRHHRVSDSTQTETKYGFTIFTLRYSAQGPSIAGCAGDIAASKYDLASLDEVWRMVCKDMAELEEAQLLVEPAKEGVPA